MAEIASLKRARKKQARARAQARAAANRAAHGQTKAAKAARRLEQDKTTKTVDGARLRDDSKRGPG